MNILEKAYQKHKTWLSICRSFGLDEPTAEDIVMEMYIKIHEMSEIKGKNFVKLGFNPPAQKAKIYGIMNMS